MLCIMLLNCGVRKEGRPTEMYMIIVYGINPLIHMYKMRYFCVAHVWYLILYWNGGRLYHCDSKFICIHQELVVRSPHFSDIIDYTPVDVLRTWSRRSTLEKRQCLGKCEIRHCIVVSFNWFLFSKIVYHHSINKQLLVANPALLSIVEVRKFWHELLCY